MIRVKKSELFQMNYRMRRGKFCTEYARAKAEILPVPVLEANSPWSPPPPWHQSKRHLQTWPSAQPGAHKSQCWGLQSPLCSAANCRENLIFRQAVGCSNPGPGALCSAPLANSWTTAGGNSTRSPTPAQPGWRQSTAAVPQQAGAARLTPLECRQRLCALLSAPRMKSPSELLRFGEGARAAAPPPSPVGSQPGAAHTERYAVWDTWSIS